MAHASCILVELTDASLWAFSYPDEESARAHFNECRSEWNAGRTLIFYLARNSTNRFAPPVVEFLGDEVAHIELTSREEAERRNVDVRRAVVHG